MRSHINYRYRLNFTKLPVSAVFTAIRTRCCLTNSVSVVYIINQTRITQDGGSYIHPYSSSVLSLVSIVANVPVVILRFYLLFKLSCSEPEQFLEPVRCLPAVWKRFSFILRTFAHTGWKWRNFRRVQYAPSDWISNQWARIEYVYSSTQTVPNTHGRTRFSVHSAWHDVQLWNQPDLLSRVVETVTKENNDGKNRNKDSPVSRWRGSARRSRRTAHAYVTIDPRDVDA